MKYIVILVIILAILLTWKYMRPSVDLSLNNETEDFNITLVSYKEKRSLQETFTSLKLYYEQHYPEISETLNPPATDKELDDLEEIIGIKLPNDFRQLYKIANGQKNSDQSFFQEGYEFLSIKGIVYQWEILKGLYDSEEMFREVDNNKGVILEAWWRPEWIPFGYMISGDLYCLDLSPGDKGVHGQIIEFIHDDSIRYHMGESIVDYLGELESGLKLGQYFMHKEYEVITSEE